MRFSVITSGIVAAIVGFGGPLTIFIQASQSLSATQMDMASGLTALCITIAVTSMVLSLYYKMPIITSWSTPGLALIGATTGYSMSDATGAYIVTALAIFATALIKPLSVAFNRIPMAISSAMLAGVLFSFIVNAAKTIGIDPLFVLPLFLLFFVIYFFQPALAVVAVLIIGFFYAFLSHRIVSLPPLEISTLQFFAPSFESHTIIGLALPLFLVTMASQNLPGFAVLKAFGYDVPTKSCLGVTGLFSAFSAFLGASTCNMSAMAAAICTGPDTHPDKTQRWKTVFFYSLSYVLFAIFGASLIAIFLSLPKTFIILIAGLGLLGSFTNALSIALSVEKDRIAAMVTFAVTASGITLLSVGAPFWALVAGLGILGLKRLLNK